ncbi:MAG: hypothetical protein Q4C03_04265 [bacterium]|nr:hypothetical protein [bacterium]
MRLIDADALESYGLSRFFDDYAFDVIDKMPTIDAVEVKHGHWKPHPIYPKEWDVCTSCGLGTKRREYGINPDGTEWRSEVSYTYCPWCGAKMDEVK